MSFDSSAKMEVAIVRFFIFSTKVFAVSTLIFLNFSSLNAQPDPAYVLPAGTRIKVRMDTEISSKVNAVNDTFIVRVIEAVTNESGVMIPAGSIIDGRIARVERADIGGVNGRLEPEFIRLRLNRRDAIELDARLVKPLRPPSRSLFKIVTIGGFTAIGALFGAAADGKQGAAIGAAIGAGSGAGVAYLRKGEDVRIKTNEEFEIELKKEVILPAREF